MSISLIENIKLKEDAGFRTKGKVYQDHLGFDTIGYGTKLPLSQEECELLLRHRLSKVLSEINSSFHDLDAPSELWDILYEMCYQLGLPRLLKFKKMIAAIYDKNYELASYEMKNSKWYIQTPNRVERLAERLASLK